MTNKSYIYTIYSITPVNGIEYNASYKQVAKYYSKDELCYKVNYHLKKDYEEHKAFCMKELKYFHEAEEEDSLRRSELKEMIKSDFVPKSYEDIISYYKNNDLLFYSNERLYDYLQWYANFFITISYI
jgi:hypothetical protein